MIRTRSLVPAALASLLGAKTLKLTDCRQLTDVAFVNGMEALEELHITGCDRIEHLDGLDHLPLITTIQWR